MAFKRTKLESSHIFFLNTFLVPRTPEDLPTLSREEWKICLGADPLYVTRELVRLGFLAKSSLYDQLNHKYIVSELRTLLEQRNLPTSGTKKQLIQRLLETAYEAMIDLTSHLELFTCSEKGIKLLRSYWNSIEDGETSLLRNLKVPQDKLRELRGFILGSITGGIIGNRADAIFVELIRKLPKLEIPKPSDSMHTPEKATPTIKQSRKNGISLIIPVNNPQHLGWVLRRVMKQTRVPDEIIVVDDTSTINVKRLIKPFGCKYLRINEGPGKRALARQVGADGSGYNILVYCDQDILMAPKLIEGFEAYANTYPDNIIRPITFEFSLADIQKGVPFCDTFLDGDAFCETEQVRLDKEYLSRIKGRSYYQQIRGRSYYQQYITELDIYYQIRRIPDWLNLNFDKEILWRTRFYGMSSNCFYISYGLLNKVGGWNVAFEGYGFEDIELYYRLDQEGIGFFYGAFPLFAVFHLFHKINERIQKRECMASYFRFVSETGWDRHHLFYNWLPELRKLSPWQIRLKTWWMTGKAGPKQ